MDSDELDRNEPGMLEIEKDFAEGTYLGGPQILASPKRVVCNFTLHGEEFSLTLFTL